MGKSRIEWTEETWNPTTGCDQVSPGCDNCYAMRTAARWKLAGAAKYQTDGNPPTSGPGFGIAEHPSELDRPRRWQRPRIVFVDSMSDLFHPGVSDDFIAKVFATMAETGEHVYQVLTKRSQRLASMAGSLPWPENVWMGVSIESARYEFRADHLRQVPAAVRFISAEPLLGSLAGLNLDGIGWVIVGGESGPGHRPMSGDWAVEMRDKCEAAGVPFFFKQWGGHTPKAGGRTLDGRVHDAMPPTSGRKAAA